MYQAEDERNYHVFYQLIKGAPQAEREELFLSHDIDDYFYINQGGCETVDDVNDVTEFAETQVIYAPFFLKYYNYNNKQKKFFFGSLRCQRLAYLCLSNGRFFAYSLQSFTSAIPKSPR